MAAHKGPASLRPRCTGTGSSVAAIQVYQSTTGECVNGWKDFKTEDETSVINTGVVDQLVWQLRR
jgi:hypothetical protein